MIEKLADRSRKLLELVPEGDSMLREKCSKLSKKEIMSHAIQDLIDDMKYTCDEKKVGVGLSANQIGEPVAISVVAIKPTPARPNLDVFDKVCINTEITETFGELVPQWEGCLSTAIDENGEPAMALIPRYEKVRIKYLDRNGDEQEETVEGFIAQVMQHETDHLDGVLFTDYINEDNLMSYQEYIQSQEANKKRDLSEVVIESERLVLRPLSYDHKQEMFVEFNENVTRWLTNGPNESLEKLNENIANQIKEAENGESVTFEVLSKDGEFLGRGSLENTNTKTPEFGLWFKESAQGKGYGPEFIRAVHGWASDNLDVDYFLYRADKGNIGSWKIAEKMIAEFGGEFIGEEPEVMRGKDTITRRYHILPK